MGLGSKISVSLPATQVNKRALKLSTHHQEAGRWPQAPLWPSSCWRWMRDLSLLCHLKQFFFVTT